MKYRKIIFFLIDFIFFPFFCLSVCVLYINLTCSVKRYKPSLVFGPIPIISNKYWASALREKGYVAKTIVVNYYHINKKEDFDIYYDDFHVRWLGKLNKLWVDYVVFFYAILNFDIFHFSFDGGFLQTRFFARRLEFFCYKILGKKTVILPYGSDIYLYSKIIDIPWKQSLIINYPENGKNEQLIKTKIEFIQKNADFIVAYIDYVFILSYWHMLTVGAYIIDEDIWYSDVRVSDHNGENGTVKIAHAPNHRGVKGTEFVLDAIENLKKKGYDIELVLIEKKKNDEVKEILKECDILIDQLNLGYALNAIEGMALSMPVITNLTNDTYTKVFKQYAFLDECPLVSTDYVGLEDTLEKLIASPELRKEKGKMGRLYIEKYHSKKTAFLMFENIYKKLWKGEDIDLINYFHPKIGRYHKDYLSLNVDMQNDLFK